ncbi:DUF3298 and DUF4163 domain-containing protein [Metabacillus sp. 84]|uniref:DUF3298 and DUF4163 domain-containing protein n=1 Tax=Metabacillus sp. 84 TaxID=3404705 RepID=UPI003CEBF7A6
MNKAASLIMAAGLAFSAAGCQAAASSSEADAAFKQKESIPKAASAAKTENEPPAANPSAETPAASHPAGKGQVSSNSSDETANGVKIVKHTYKDTPVEYAQVSGLSSREAEKAINGQLLAEAKENSLQYLKLMQKEEKHKEDWEKDGKPYEWTPYEFKTTYKVSFNKNHLLSIISYDYQYEGGAHGSTIAKTMNFNVKDGSAFKLLDVIQNKKEAVKNYAVEELTAQSEEENSMIFKDTLKDIEISNDRAWTFEENGLTLIFQQYEIAAYAGGMPEVSVPLSVYQ